MASFRFPSFLLVGLTTDKCRNLRPHFLIPFICYAKRCGEACMAMRVSEATRKNEAWRRVPCCERLDVVVVDSFGV